MKKSILLGLLAAATSAAFAQTSSKWTASDIATTTTGKAAIGTTTYENTKLTIRNIQYLTTGNAASALKIMNGVAGGTGNIMEIWNGPYQEFAGGGGGGVSYNPDLVFWINNQNQVGIKNNLRIGTAAANGAYANYKLSVDGDMIAKRCVIQVDNWADYVFEDNYSLPTLTEVATYVKENKHLPGVPSEAEIKAKGVDMGEMNKILMQKVEELTLYMIDLKKEVDQLKAKN